MRILGKPKPTQTGEFSSKVVKAPVAHPKPKPPKKVWHEWSALVIYGSLLRWSPQHFRATMHAYFLPASLMEMVGYWSTGLWTRTVTTECLLSVAVIVPAVSSAELSTIVFQTQGSSSTSMVG